MKAIQLFNPAGLYDPVPNGYSHGATVPAGLRLVLLSGQGGEDQAGVLRAGYAAQLRPRQRGAGARGGRCRSGACGAADEQKLHQLGAEFDRIWGDRMKPACTLIPVPRLALDGMLVEIEATAAVPA